MDVRALLSFGLNNKGDTFIRRYTFSPPKKCARVVTFCASLHKDPSLLSPPFARGAADKDTGLG